MQLVIVGHDTPENVVRVTFGSGESTGRRTQLEPFQVSPRGWSTPALVTNPPALHAIWKVLVAHDTACNWLVLPVGRPGLCTVQLIPSQVSASGPCLLAELTKSPTAKQL